MGNELKNNIRKYYLFQFVNNLVFFSPVIVLFWQSHGLTMTQIMLLQSIYSVGVVVLELPTGAFADYFGKKQSLMIGALFWTIGIIWYGSSTVFWQFVIGELTVGIGSAFISGADRAYIHDLLSKEQKEIDFKKVEGKARGIIQVSQALGSVIGGLIASISLSLPLLTTSISAFLGFIVSSRFPTIHSAKKEHSKIGYFMLIKESIILTRQHKRLLWLTLFFASFNGLLWPLMLYTQPLLTEYHVPIYYFGFIYFVFNLISALGSSLTHTFEKVTQKKVFLVMSILVVLILIITTTIHSIVTFPLWSLFVTFIFMNQTIISDKVLKIIPFEKAATILSFQSLIRRLLYAVVGPILGILTDTFGIQKALLGYSAFLFFVFGALLLYEKKLNT